jgi:hypothetical protein
LSSWTDLLAEATFERVIDGNDQWLVGGNEHLDDHPEQDRAQLQGRPDGTVEHTMVGCEVPVVRQPDSA